MTDVDIFNTTGTEELFRCEPRSRYEIDFDVANVNKVPIYPSESLLNYLARAILIYQLRRMRKDVATDVKVDGAGFIDVLDLETNIGYNIIYGHIRQDENLKERFREAGIELVEVQILNYTTDFGWLAEYVKKWIRP